MRLGRLGEFGSIERIKSQCKKPGRDVKAGIGDDAAVYRTRGALALAAADMMVEDVHFELGLAGFRELGYRALASNLSDIAAMGGRPLYYMVSLAVPAAATTESLDMLYMGMEEAAGPHGVRLIGGDTCSSPGPVVVSVTVLGEAGEKGPVMRSGARPGDDIYVTGTLGDSAAGLELLKAGARAKRSGADRRGGKGGGSDIDEYLVSRHLGPTARVAAGMLLCGVATSMIDVSDGLSSDLGHLLEASGAGALVYADSVPLSGELVSYAGAAKALKFALDGGEDYELLFTARPGSKEKVAGVAAVSGVSISRLGEITKGKGAYLVAGKGSVRQLKPGGYEHFRK